jgi:hypothetical protein
LNITVTLFKAGQDFYGIPEGLAETKEAKMGYVFRINHVKARELSTIYDGFSFYQNLIAVAHGNKYPGEHTRSDIEIDREVYFDEKRATFLVCTGHDGAYVAL